MGISATIASSGKAAARFEIEVQTDAPSRVPPFLADLETAGFSVAALTTIPAESALSATIEIRPGPMASSEVDTAKVLTIADAFARGIGIDAGRYPVQRRDAKGDPRTIVMLPIDACASGRRPPYAGLDPARFEVMVASDDRDIGQAFVDDLKAKGYRTLRRSLGAIDEAFTITHPNTADGLAFAEAFRRPLELAIKAAAGADEDLYGIAFKAKDVTQVTITLPIRALKSGELRESLSSAGRFACAIYGDVSSVPATTLLRKRLAEFRWRSIEVRHDREESGPRIVYGGAPKPLLQKVRAAIAALFPDVRLEMEKRWNTDDRDVWIFTPPKLSVPTPPPATTAAVAAPAISGRSFVTLRDDSVAIGGHVLPRRPPSPRAPDPATLARYAVDQGTAETLDRVAASVLAAEPCLLEGETATSKTSVIAHLATLLRQPMIRLNLNAETDTGELIGRYVPAPGGGWRWQDGAAPLALRRGDWLVLDEINLARPSVIERLNSALEASPSLMVSEGDGRQIGGGGEAVDPHFRVFATINPAEGYAGRSPLSPAIKDRFAGYHRTRVATEADIRDLLGLLFLGRQPAVVIDGVLYEGGGGNAPAALGDLGARIPDLPTLIGALARFHVGAAAICDGANGVIDKPVITRRALLALVGRLAAAPALATQGLPAQIWSGLEHYYLIRAVDDAMRRSMVELATAAGLRRDGWSGA